MARILTWRRVLDVVVTSSRAPGGAAYDAVENASVVYDFDERRLEALELPTKRINAVSLNPARSNETSRWR